MQFYLMFYRYYTSVFTADSDFTSPAISKKRYNNNNAIVAAPNPAFSFHHNFNFLHVKALTAFHWWPFFLAITCYWSSTIVVINHSSCEQMSYFVLWQGGLNYSAGNSFLYNMVVMDSIWQTCKRKIQYQCDVHYSYPCCFITSGTFN